MNKPEKKTKKHIEEVEEENEEVEEVGEAEVEEVPEEVEVPEEIPKKETPKKELPNPFKNAKITITRVERTGKGRSSIVDSPPKKEKEKAPSGAIPPILDPEKEASLKLILDEVNQRIKHFRNLGYATGSDGTLYLPKLPTEAVQTGVKATIVKEGTRFYLNVGALRQYNQLIKELGGSWKQYRSAWEFQNLALLPVVRNAFHITEETVSTKTPAEVYKSTVPKPEHPQKITLSLMGDYIVIKGDTKPIKDDLKAVIQMRWDALNKQWITSKTSKKTLDKTLDSLVEGGKLISYEYEEEDEDDE